MNGSASKNAVIVSLAIVVFSLGLATGCSQGETSTETSAPAAGQQDLWTCGMHPHVLEEDPGQCPICGMDLTPVTPGELEASVGERKIKYWTAPMDPTFIADGPGKSPMGMDLVPVYERKVPGRSGRTVSIDPVVTQNMGVRIARVERKPIFRHVRTVGEVEVAEDRMSVVNLRFSGWVEKIIADKTGEPIEKGEPLFEIYSPDLVSAQEEYLLALRSQGRKSALARSARRKLDLFGLDQRDIQAIARSGRASRSVAIRAPRSGYILHKNVVEGARVSEGQDLYTIGDLSIVWVQAEVYENDAAWVEVGQPAQMELTYQKGKVIDGSVAYVYPMLNKGARTLTVRLEFPNPELRLKPGMFATVYIEFRREDDSLVLPTEAILHSGTRELVFVALGDGRFEPREITTGLIGDRHTTQVLSGLTEGEDVVTSGQFLIDSESQLQEAIAKMLARRSATDSGRSKLDGDQFVHACPMHPDQISHEPGECGICGMELEKRTATPEELSRIRSRQGDAARDRSHMTTISNDAHPAGDTSGVMDHSARDAMSGDSVSSEDAP